jgi:sorbose reductase
VIRDLDSDIRVLVLNEGGGLTEARNIWTARNPSGRMGLPSELTGAVVLLSSSAGSYMNGM